MSSLSRADPSARPGLVNEGLGGSIDDKALPATCDVLDDIDAFIAAAPPVRAPRRLIDRFLARMDAQSAGDARICEALRVGNYSGAADLLRRRDAGDTQERLAADADALALHFDELAHRPSLGRLRGMV